MTPTATVLFAAAPEQWPEYEAPLRSAFAERGLSVDLRMTVDEPERIDLLVYAPNGPVRDFSPFTRARAVLNLWAGVEDVVGNPTLTQPLARMVDPGLTAGMVEWVTGHVLRHHLGIDRHMATQDGTWLTGAPPLARSRPVTILGLGTLGTACARMLGSLGFPVSGWSRTAHRIDGVACHHGSAGLVRALTGAEIVVALLPLTAATENLIDAKRLAVVSPGAVLLNPGRGGLVDDAALVAALDSGQIGHATLDTFRVEPLPADHIYWRHPKVTVTPHIASQTRPDSAARVIAENAWRAMTDQPLLHVVDRARGY